MERHYGKFGSMETHILETEYKKNCYLPSHSKQELAKLLKRKPLSIEAWFKRRRARDQRNTQIQTRKPVAPKLPVIRGHTLQSLNDAFIDDNDHLPTNSSLVESEQPSTSQIQCLSPTLKNDSIIVFVDDGAQSRTPSPTWNHYLVSAWPTH